MKWHVKLLFAGIIITLITGVFIYCYNIDMYRAVENMSPVNGFPALVEHLRDKQWVEANYTSWATAQSPVLQSLYMYLTGQEDYFPTYVINANRSFMVLWSYTSMFTWPLMLYMSVKGAKRRRKEMSQ